MNWPEITKDTPLEEIKRIHQQIWQYVVENGEKPSTTYLCDCSLCEYVYENFGFLHCCECPAKWSGKDCRSNVYEIDGKGEFLRWFIDRDLKYAKDIRDIPFKYELEKKGAEE